MIDKDRVRDGIERWREQSINGTGERNGQREKRNRFWQ